MKQTIEADVTAVDKRSAQNLRNARRPRMNFHELGIPNGSVLVSKDGARIATVIGEKKVDLEGTICSLTAATRTILNLPDRYPIQPSPYWIYNGRTVKEIYDELHDEEEDS